MFTIYVWLETLYIIKGDWLNNIDIKAWICSYVVKMLVCKQSYMP